MVVVRHLAFLAALVPPLEREAALPEDQPAHGQSVQERDGQQDDEGFDQACGEADRGEVVAGEGEGRQAERERCQSQAQRLARTVGFTCCDALRPQRTGRQSTPGQRGEGEQSEHEHRPAQSRREAVIGVDRLAAEEQHADHELHREQAPQQAASQPLQGMAARRRPAEVHGGEAIGPRQPAAERQGRQRPDEASQRGSDGVAEGVTRFGGAQPQARGEPQRHGRRRARRQAEPQRLPGVAVAVAADAPRG